ncbi:Hpt domain-containing protein [Oligoflexus sp.]|uniref:Hpt domain-containing protein n=1 Tax=Oligoflexus sp. TaxID=1971216 RepID=UPI002D802698|nr:Hpt domain-containing protein [Oligoflexus sp.]
MGHNWTKPFEKFMEFCGIRMDGYPSIQEFWFARSSFLFTNIGLIVALSYMGLYLGTGAYAAALSIGSLAVILLLTHPLHWYGKTRLLAYINLAATSFGLAGVALHLGGIRSSVACWLLGTAPGIAALLFRRVKEIVLLTLFAMILYAGIFLLELQNYPIHQTPFPEGSPADSLFTFLTFMSYAIFICIALSIFAFSQKKLYEALQRTKEKGEATAENIKAMFHFMEQVMFTVDASLGISNQNEQQFSLVLGSDVKGLGDFLARSSLPGDQEAMVKNIIQACIGEGMESFEFNAHHLPARLHYRKQPDAAPQVLNLQWTPVMRGTLIRAILIAIRDSTNAELDQAREEEAHIRNSFLLALLKAPAAIVRLTIADMVALERRLDAALSAERMDLLGLKSLVHTLKGNARSFGLKVITERCHALENRLQAFPNLDDPGVKELVMKLRSDLVLFVTIYQEDLASRRSEAVQIPREAVQIPHESRCEDVVQILKNDLEKISAELGKPTPDLLWNDGNVSLCDEQISMLINVLGHLIRNSCDHGIEEADERRARQKPLHGHILIDLEREQDGYVIKFRDDGRGLHLNKIRQRLGVPLQVPWDDERLARTIFEPEFTTKDAVSCISGRGIGMTAVVDELSSLQGGISIEFTAPEEGGFRPFMLLLRWPFRKAA